MFVAGISYRPARDGESVTLQRSLNRAEKVFALFLLGAFCVLPGCTAFSRGAGAPCSLPEPRSVILLIGDGMGVSHVTAGKIGKGILRLEEFSTVGLLMTSALDFAVTDSAAAATALATGQKTRNEYVSMSAERGPLRTVIEHAADAGKSVGIVTTRSVTDATPAAFVAHVLNREQHQEIAEQLVARNLDVIFGGGLGYFLPQSHENSLRSDEKDLVTKLLRGVTVARTPKEFGELSGTGRAAALLANKHLLSARQRAVSLAAMVEKAIKILSHNPRGFFLMVEAGHIDGGGHINSGDFILSEMVDFDDAVGVALEFAREDMKTLVVVTADHETGGFAIHDATTDREVKLKVGFTTTGHTAAMVPLFSFGPGSRALGGIHDNTHVGATLIDYMRQSAD